MGSCQPSPLRAALCCGVRAGGVLKHTLWGAFGIEAALSGLTFLCLPGRGVRLTAPALEYGQALVCRPLHRRRSLTLVLCHTLLFPDSRLPGVVTDKVRGRMFFDSFLGWEGPLEVCALCPWERLLKLTCLHPQKFHSPVSETLKWHLCPSCCTLVNLV